MRELFVMDKKNYKTGGTIGRRPSVRGIITKDDKLAMIHSLKYNYYKLPGGGIEGEESFEDTLVREVKEESGLVVLKDSIQEFGYVKRIEKGNYQDIFIQENFYFLCETNEIIVEQNLDDYENEEQFVLEFVTPEEAIRVNRESNHYEKSEKEIFRGMIERENRVLEIVNDEVLRKTKFYFVRHGKTDYSEETYPIYQGMGLNMCTLSEEGVTQIENVAKDTRFQNADIIITSPYGRTLHSAGVMSRALNLEVIVETKLHEWIASKDGQWLNTEEADHCYELFTENKGFYPDGEICNYETVDDIKNRINEVLNKYISYKKVIVVCHGTIMQYFLNIDHPNNGEIVEYEL
jgi:broad specificity phosphatase PhoE/8-oxo-dGTP pyrophosphatase MutT (NUDIX family)